MGHHRYENKGNRLTVLGWASAFFWRETGRAKRRRPFCVLIYIDNTLSTSISRQKMRPLCSPAVAAQPSTGENYQPTLCILKIYTLSFKHIHCVLRVNHLILLIYASHLLFSPNYIVICSVHIHCILPTWLRVKHLMVLIYFFHLTTPTNGQDLISTETYTCA